MIINKQDTNGVKPLLQTGELGFDNFASGGDKGRVYVGNGASNIALAKKSEVDAKVVANANITAGTGTKVTYDSKGLVTSSTTPTTLAGYSIGDTYTKGQADAALALKVDNSDLDQRIDTKLDITTVKLTENQTVAGVKTFSSNIVGNITGNSGTASKLQTARTITLSGDASGSVNFDGSGNVSITVTVADDSHIHSFANITNKPTTVSGYGIIDAYTKDEVNTKIDTVISDSSTSTSLTWSSDKIDESITTAVGAINLSSKQDILVSGTNIKTVNSSSILGSGNLALLASINPVITGSITEQVYNLTGTAINPANGTIQYKTVSANTTFTETLTSGQSVLLRLIDASNYTITFPTITWIGAVAPVLTANCAIVIW